MKDDAGRLPVEVATSKEMAGPYWAVGAAWRPQRQREPAHNTKSYREVLQEAFAGTVFITPDLVTPGAARQHAR